MQKRSTEISSFSDSAPMEQVRELLFGAQLKEMDIRLQRQEERFQREIGDSREALKKRIDSLENFMKSEIATLLHRVKAEQEDRENALKSEQRERADLLKSEQRERNEAIEQLAKDLANLAESFERKITKVSSTLDNAERELRQIFLAESNSLTEKVEAKYQDALDVISSTAVQIRHDMVHRSALSSLFTEAAIKLSGQWAPDTGHLILAGSAGQSPKNDVEDESSNEVS